ncbi:MAG: dynamin family protein [Burkholderiales bacterium]|jgi:hypothetical protein|nr:dynamin family protein [Burkholderiales bacterium]
MDRQLQNLAARFEAYSQWRRQLSSRIEKLEQWLTAQTLTNPQTQKAFEQIRARLNEDKLVLAFVAEFSRGKSELINALFFSGFGQRLLPSSAGRTTMCPTELLYDPKEPPHLLLLPVETRKDKTSVTDLKRNPSVWESFPLDLSTPEAMSETLQRVSQIKQVPLNVAHQYGFFDTDEEATKILERGDDKVDIPCWRHAIINFPHPMLEQGLVILDTPGLNAIGTEPELTFSLLPSAHSVLYILAADAGVTKTDLDVWEQHLVSSDPASKHGHVIVLNKIDGLWDELKTAEAIQGEIDKQVESTAKILDIPPEQIYPLSAQKGLLAKISGDDKLLERSRVPELEQALTSRILPARRQIVSGTTQADLYALIRGIRGLLDMREDGMHEQLDQLFIMRNKNKDVVLGLLDQTKTEKQAFEQGLARYTAMRRIFTHHTNALLDATDMDALRANANRTHLALEAASQTKNVRRAIDMFFTTLVEDLSEAEKQAEEIYEMVKGMSSRFSKELKMRPFEPRRYSFEKCCREIDRLHHAYVSRFDTLWGRTARVKLQPMQRFFEAIVTRAKHVYHVANRDAESWLKNIMVPLETQIRERHQQLRKHQENARQIAVASNEAEEHVREFKEQLTLIKAQQKVLEAHLEKIDVLLAQTESDTPAETKSKELVISQ